MSPERALARLRRSLGRWRHAVHLDLRPEAQIAVRVTGLLDRALARRLARNLRAVLERSRVRVVLAFETLGERLLVVVGHGLREMLRCEAPLPA